MTITITADRTIVSGEQFNFSNEMGFYLQESAPSAAPSLIVNGTINVTATDFDLGFRVAGVFIGASGFCNSQVTIGTTGVIKVDSTVANGIGYGFWSPSWSPDVTNHGLIDVSAKSTATGVETSDSSFVFNNTGSIKVVSAQNANGVSMGNGGQFTNTGVIDVSGTSDRVSGVGVGRTGSDFLNSGTIHVDDHGNAASSTGVLWESTGSFTNSGTITADTALLVIGDGVPGAQTIANSGSLVGAVTLGISDAQLVNSGSITGAVDLGAGNDTYSGASGLLRGALHGGDGSDLIVGGIGAETLSGDLGDDTIDGGGGADVLDGGAGIDMLSFGRSATGVTLNLAAGATQTGIVGTAVNFEGIIGSGFDDSITGSSSGESLNAGAGADTVMAGAGNDTILDPTGQNYLRGEDGDDVITGGSGFDDANGNMGNDTIHGGAGDDYSVGGKDNDVLFGDAGVDIVWGNLGNDTIDGGDGNDQVRGGQGDDIVNGGAGNDYVSGDRGNDTITGGTGADIFHDSQDAGIDRVLDFNLAEGDKVMLDPGTTFTVSQVGADAVIDMGSGNQMILVGVQASSLPAGTIFLG